MDHQAIQKISQDLVSAGLKIGMIFFPEDGGKLRFSYPEICQLQHPDDVVVGKFERNAQLFHDIVVRHFLFKLKRYPLQQKVYSHRGKPYAHYPQYFPLNDNGDSSDSDSDLEKGYSPG
jgi:hypothetical protein